MDLIFWWVPIAAVAVIAVATAITVVLARRHRRAAPTGRAIANATRLTSLPGYRRALVRYRAAIAGLGVAVLVLVIGSVGLASRPASTAVVYPELNNRDIVLCLDVSGSMIDYDAELVDVFSELAKRFDGERLSLVVFNASAVTYFPLTSDYAYIDRQFERIGAQFADATGEYFAGTFFGDGSSLIGDGLASCVQRFDTPDQDRSRSIILATDNLVVGNEIFTLPEAGALASSRDVRVYGLNPGDQSSREYLDELAVEFETVVTRTGGAYYALADPAAVPAIVDSIGAEQATVMRGAPQLITLDQPVVPFVLALLGLTALLLVAWRVDR